MFLLYRINKTRMEEIGAIILKYQPMQVLWRLLCDYARRTILSCLIRLFTRELVLSSFEESITRLHRNWFSHSSDTAYKVLPFTTKILCSSLFFFLYFHCTLFRELVGACMNPGSFFKLSFCTFTCLSNNSLISSWISAKVVSAFLPCMLQLSYYFQSEVNT